MNTLVHTTSNLPRITLMLFFFHYLSLMRSIIFCTHYQCNFLYPPFIPPSPPTLNTQTHTQHQKSKETSHSYYGQNLYMISCYLHKNLVFIS